MCILPKDIKDLIMAFHNENYENHFAIGRVIREGFEFWRYKFHDYYFLPRQPRGFGGVKPDYWLMHLATFKSGCFPRWFPGLDGFRFLLDCLRRAEEEGDACFIEEGYFTSIEPMW